MSEQHIVKIPSFGSKSLELDFSQTTVFVGANGSGKTRLGRWLVNGDGTPVVGGGNPLNSRGVWISARRAIDCPQTVQISDPESLTKQGHPPLMRPRETNDFQLVLNWLISKGSAAANKYLEESRASDTKVVLPTTEKDTFQEIWKRILPHRKVVFAHTHIKAASASNESYSPAELSDGERVVFYLIVKCLMAEFNAVIVVDEPEMHLHRSIQRALWSEIQSARPDCKFVFFTHDIEFAAEYCAQLVWLKSFDGTAWDLSIVSNSTDEEGLSNSLKLQILGSRKPVVFVEGSPSSLDASLYRALLPNYQVIPIGGCSEVIQSVKSLRKHESFHNLEVRGIIDSDRRSQAEKDALLNDGIYVLSVAEVENLFCTEEVIKLLCANQMKDFVTVFTEISKLAFTEFEQQMENQVAGFVSTDFCRRIGGFKAKNLQEIKTNLETLFSVLSVDKAESNFESKKSEFDGILKSKNYKDLLRVFNFKGLKSICAKQLGLTTEEFGPLVCRLAVIKEKHSEFVEALKGYLGGFPL